LNVIFSEKPCPLFGITLYGLLISLDLVAASS